MVRPRHSNALMMPMRGVHGETLGYMDRGFNGRKPKALMYPDVNSSLLDFAMNQPTKDICLVEDKLSAVRVSKYMTCASLSGCNLSVEDVKLLRKHTDSIYIMLDGDAIAKAREIKDTYSLFFGNFSVIDLSNRPDPKDMTDKELREVLELDK